MNRSSMSGLEQMSLFAAGKVPPPSMAVTMNTEVSEVSYGEVVMHCKAGDAHLNPMGGVHGGFAATVLDSVTGCAVHSALMPGESYGTVDLSVKLVRPMPIGKRLRAEGKLLNLSKSVATAEGRILDETGKLYAHATCTCMIQRSSKEG